VRQLVDRGLARLHTTSATLAPRPPEDPSIACTDHPCDNCTVCRRGLCCRADNPTRPARLAGWDDPIYGELGVLESDGDRVCCHACGGWYVLGSHAFAAHGLTAEIYKIVFWPYTSRQVLPAPDTASGCGRTLSASWRRTGRRQPSCLHRSRQSNATHSIVPSDWRRARTPQPRGLGRRCPPRRSEDPPAVRGGPVPATTGARSAAKCSVP
jgi:hypothetical protein